MPVSYDLSGRRAVVTGGARGIGREIAGLLVTSGARVTSWISTPSSLTAPRRRGSTCVTRAPWRRPPTLSLRTARSTSS